MQPRVKITISHLAIPSGIITYHDIIAFNQKLSVKGSRNFKRPCNFPSGNLNLNEGGEKKKDGINGTFHFSSKANAEGG